MKVRPSIVEQLDIVKVFHHAKDDWNTLYVEFGSELEVDILYSYTKNIKKNDHRVFPYIPKRCTGGTEEQKVSCTLSDRKKKSRLK